MRQPVRLMTVMGGARATPYYEKVLAIQPTNLIQYLRLNETSGSAADDLSTEGNNGAYSAAIQLANAAGPDGVLCAHFDGTAYVNVYSAGFNADFVGNELTVAAWIKVENLGIWTDGATRRVIGFENVDGTNYFHLQKTTTNNRLAGDIKMGGVAKAVNINSMTATGWFHIAMTISKMVDEYKLYINGAQSGTTQTGLGSWSGNLVSTQCNIGAYTQVPTFPFIGWLAHSAIWKTALTPAEVLQLATINP
jgi:hypothetical protein